MKFDPVKDVPELDGKVVIVTGSTSGIGFATAQILVRKGAKVYLAARSEEKAKACLKRIEDEGHEKGTAEWHHLDLADPALAKASAEEFLKKEERLDILSAFSSLVMDEFKMGSRGIQEALTTNHFSPFVFTSVLLPLLKSTATLPNSDVRIINVSSAGYILVSPTQFKTKDDFNLSYEGEWFASMKRYGLSKLCNILWTKELQRRLSDEGSNIICIVLHPGTVFTENVISQVKGFPAILRPVAMPFCRAVMLNPTQGAGTQVIAATTPEAKKNPEKYKGAYLEPMGKIVKLSKTGGNAALAQELWTTTEALLKEMDL
ncbi:NAD-binding protein [Schizopora paradoxa]|uniref:NAD-binding protein n=1 Tax=Schizopora paradoxa TaxID=27342 RepID=A0A0H2RFZ3_9AGAM|nr:NAD-binding protein [Schizopora paradoxa]